MYAAGGERWGLVIDNGIALLVSRDIMSPPVHVLARRLLIALCN
jgi:hypothetical protein